jgi:hypothetical protein
LRKKGSVKKCPVSNNTLVFDNILKKQETPFIQEFNSYLHSKRVVFFAHALPVGGRHEGVVLRERHVTAGGATVPLKGKGRKTNKEKKKTQGPQKNQKSKITKSEKKKKKNNSSVLSSFFSSSSSFFVGAPLTSRARPVRKRFACCPWWAGHRRSGRRDGCRRRCSSRANH